MAITGKVVAGREAVVPLMVVGFRGRSTEIEAVIDTGQLRYGHLTLAPDLARSLDLPLLGSRYVTLANGATTPLEVGGLGDDAVAPPFTAPSR